LIAQNVNAIVLNTINGKITENIEDLQTATNLGIPVFLLDAVLEMDGVYSVTIDQHQWALLGLEWLTSKTEGSGSIVTFDLYPDYHHGDMIEKYFSMTPNLKVIAGVDQIDNFDPGWAKPRTADFARQLPDLQAVWTNVNFEGVLQGISEESGLAFDQWPALLCEASGQGLGAWERVRAQNPNFDCIALGNPPGIAYDSAYAAYYLSSGMRVNPSALSGYFGRSLTVDIPVVTSDTLDQWLKENPSVDQVMTPDEIRQNWFLD